MSNGKSAPASNAPPKDRDTDGSRNGSGAQTALQAMLKKRRMGVTREAEADPPREDGRDPNTK